MKKITGVIKINILSLVAIPLLLLAVGVKMLSKALDKIMFLIGVAVILLGAWLSSIILQLPSEVLNTVLTVILIVAICAVITMIIVLLFRFASGVITTASTFVIDFLNRTYELFYRGYSALYHKCRRCYEEQLSEMTNPNLKKVLCLFYSILRVVNECIIFFATHALKLLILVIILLVVGTLFLLNRQTHAILGLNLFTTLGLFSVRDVLASAVPYAASVFCIGTLLISVGLEWNEWGREMKMATTDYEGYLNKIAEIRARLDEAGEGTSQKGAVQRCREYMDKLNCNDFN